MDTEVASKGIDLGGRYLDDAGALPFTLLLLLLLAVAILVLGGRYFVKHHSKEIKAKEAAVTAAKEENEENLKALETQHKRLLKERDELHSKVVLDLRQEHIKELLALTKSYEALTQKIMDAIPEWARIINRQGDDFRRIYDLLKSLGSEASDERVSSVKVQTEIAGILENLPQAVELIFRKLQAERQPRRGQHGGISDGSAQG